LPAAWVMAVDKGRCRIGIVVMDAAGQGFIPVLVRHQDFDRVALTNPDEAVRVRLKN